MTYDNFWQTITNSTPDEWLYDDENSTYVFKNDLSISIVGSEIDYSESGKFYEEWAIRHPDATARRKEFSLCYNGVVIERFYTAAVDGLRMYIPYPNLDTMSISSEQYAIGKIVNIPNEGYGYESYLHRCGITY
ncbi:MAG: hypothetical protein E7290_01970 [Lachnospiraceae bacterium]|nr:hypothetical protein [Lachnospiraceae bacterium]